MVDTYTKGGFNLTIIRSEEKMELYMENNAKIKPVKNILIGTGNENKLKEFNRILRLIEERDGINCRIELSAPKYMLEGSEEPEETGELLEENAEIKARFYSKMLGMFTISEDSGLFVDALDGAPGVYSSRYAGDHGNSFDNIHKLIDEMHKIGVHDSDAKFVDAMCLCAPDGTVLATATGEVKGLVRDICKGDGGFGYDPLFYPMINVDGKDVLSNLSFAEFTDNTKSFISHRSVAFRKILAEISKYESFDKMWEEGSKKYA